MHLETILTKVLGRLVGWPSHRLLVLPEVAPQHQLPSCSDQAAMALVPTRRVVVAIPLALAMQDHLLPTLDLPSDFRRAQAALLHSLAMLLVLLVQGISAPSPATSFGSLPPLGTNGGNTSSSGAFQFGTGGAGGSAPFTLGATSGTPGPAMGAISGGGAGFSMGASEQGQGSRRKVRAKFKKK